MDFSKVRNYLFLGLQLAVTIVFISLMRPFAYPIFWAAVIAGLSYPVFKWINKKINHENLSTAITLLLVLLIIVIPLLVIGTLMVRQSIELYLSFNPDSGQINNTIQSIASWITNNPWAQKFNINEQYLVDRLSEIGLTVTNYIFTSLKALTQNSLTFVVMFIIMFYTLFFFIRDGKKFLKKLMHLCPLGDKYEKILYDKFVSTTKATIKGSIIIGVIQGTLGGLLFYLTGIPGALIWGIIMVVASMIPGLGSFIIWFPAAFIMFVLGNYWQAITIVLVGSLLIGTIDNVLRPYLVGKDIQMHPLLILFSTLGGIFLFGPSGFIIGPIIASLFLAFWQMYDEYYHTDLNKN